MFLWDFGGKGGTFSSIAADSLMAVMASRSARSLSVTGSAPGSISNAISALFFFCCFQRDRSRERESNIGLERLNGGTSKGHKIFFLLSPDFPVNPV